jgi:hypothetical protein
MTFWNQIKNLLGRSKQNMAVIGDETAHQSGGAAINQNNLVDLMHRLEQTMDNAYSCEEVFALLDEYVELVATDEEAKLLMPLVKNHLEMCPDCHNKFEILLHVLKTAD